MKFYSFFYQLLYFSWGLIGAFFISSNPVVATESMNSEVGNRELLMANSEEKYFFQKSPETINQFHTD